MSQTDASPLATYNSLMDPHLSGYYSNMRMRRHLRHMGVITKKGQIVSESTYRLNMARAEHKRHVRDLLAQAIVHKTLDLERTRQVTVKKKLEEIAKVELVRRVRSERGRRGDEDILPLLSPRPKSAASRPKSGHSQASDDGRSTSRSNSQSPRRKGKSQYPNDEIDDKHLHSLDQHALQEYSSSRHGRDYCTSPYLLPQLPSDHVPAPPRSPKSRKGRPRTTRKKKSANGKSEDSQQPQGNYGSLMLHRQEPAVKQQELFQTMCEITMQYHGSKLALECDKPDPRDEVCVEQQHCGGNTLHVFKEKILPGSEICFISRRHRGYPFSLTLYVNGVMDSRLSTCCEYKHQSGVKIGGKQGHFSLISIGGGSPCYRCLVKQQMENKNKKGKPRDKKESESADNKDDTEEQKDLEVEVQDEEEEDPEQENYEDEQFENSDDEESKKKDIEVPVEDGSNSNRKTDRGESDAEQKGGERNTSRSSSRSSSRSRSRSSSSSKSRSRSRSSSSSRSARSDDGKHKKKAGTSA